MFSAAGTKKSNSYNELWEISHIDFILLKLKYL